MGQSHGVAIPLVRTPQQCVLKPMTLLNAGSRAVQQSFVVVSYDLLLLIAHDRPADEFHELHHLS